MEQQHINDIRDFNRLYAKVLGLLDKTYLDTPYSLAEARVLRELFIQPDQTAQEILTTLGLDKGYLSRILSNFENKNLILKRRSESDGRAWQLRLTALGKTALLGIDAQVNAQVQATFGHLQAAEIEEVIASMHTIKNLLNR